MTHLHTDADEHIIVQVRKHWFLLVRDMFGTLIVGAIPFVIGITIFQVPASATLLAPYTSIAIFLSALWLLTVWLTLCIIFTNHYLDVWIVTNRRIFNIQQEQLFRRRVATWNLDRVQEITVYSENFFQHLFNYGTLQVETAGPTEANATAEGVPNPEKVRSAILSALSYTTQLEEAHRAQKKILHMLSHEAKGYLSKSSATLAAISEGDFGAVPTGVKSIADSALSETRRGVSALTNILRTPDGETGLKTLEKKVFDLRAAVQMEIDSYAPLMHKKGIALTLVADDATYPINADETKIREHVIRNLIDNALHYTPNGSITVTLRKAGPRIVCIVADTGVGMDTDTLTHLFTEGRSGTDALSINPESTGYGLAIAKQIVEAHGGKIWAHSEGHGTGSRFLVEFDAAS